MHLFNTLRKVLELRKQRLNRAGVWCSSTRLALGAAAATEKKKISSYATCKQKGMLTPQTEPRRFWRAAKHCKNWWTWLSLKTIVPMLFWTLKELHSSGDLIVIFPLLIINICIDKNICAKWDMSVCSDHRIYKLIQIAMWQLDIPNMQTVLHWKNIKTWYFSHLIACTTYLEQILTFPETYLTAAMSRN